MLSKWGRIVWLIIYLVLIGGAIYGCTQLEVAFSTQLFIGESSDVYDWYDLNDKYFNKGGVPTVTYIENSSLDFSTEANQKKMVEFNTQL